MKKKIIYSIVIIVVLILGYLNYFAEDKKLKNITQVIETTDVSYRNENYEVKAQKQKDYIKKKETAFEYAKAKVNNMLLSGDNVFIDKMKNLSLKDNIIGVSENGWEFKTDKADYNKEKDEITSNSGVVAENKTRKIKLSAMKFKTNSKMNFIDVQKDVILENNSVAIIGDKGKYLDESKIVNLSDNIRLEGRGKESGLIDGHFKHLKYNLNTNLLTAWEPFDIIYKGVKLSGDKLYLNQKQESINVRENVSIDFEGFHIILDNIYKAPNSNILNLCGKIVGKSDTYNFVADNGIYDTKTKILKIYGNVKVTSKNNESLLADRIIYNSNTKIATVISKENIVYTSKEGKLITKKIAYNLEQKLGYTEDKYSFVGNRYESKGEKLSYDKISQIIKIDNGYILDKKKNQKISAKLITHNKEKKDTQLLGKAHLENKKYSLDSKDILFDSKTKMIDINNSYKLTYLKDGTVVIGNSAHYNTENQKFVSLGKIKIMGKNYIANGDDLEYNNKTGLGNLSGKTEIIGSNENFKVTGEKFNFKNGDYVELSNNVKIETKKMVGNSKLARYKFEDNVIYIPKKIDFISKDEKITGNIKSGKYIVEEDLFVGNNFTAKSIDGKNIKSKEIYYYSKEDKVRFSGDVVAKNEEYIIHGENIEYFPKIEKVKLIDDYKINYENYTLFGKDGVINNRNKTFYGQKSILKSSNGDEFESDKVSGNLNKLILDFTGNVKAKTKKDGKVTNFTGDFVRAYLKHDDKYELLRAEIRNNAIFTQEDKTLKSDYIEINFPKKIVYCKENSRLILDDKNGKTKVFAKEMELDQNKNIVILRRDVLINNVNSKYDVTKISANYGIVNRNTNILELQDDVVVENNKSTVRADKGIYNMKTRKIRALGNVFVDYKQ